MRRDYVRLEIHEFGAQLLKSRDLDPVYCALSSLQEVHEDGPLYPGWSRAQVECWLVAYWCLYHCGAASWLSELRGEQFWAGLMGAAIQSLDPPVGNRWPRGKERRYFRGAQAGWAVGELSRKYPEPEQFVAAIFQPEDHVREVHCTEIMARVQQHRLFGPWIGFKVADMGERVLGARVSFDAAHIFMFKDPVTAALMYWGQKHGLTPSVGDSREKILAEVTGELVAHFSAEPAPPRHDRPCGLQEVETILCKWKSHVRGHYPPLNDIHEIREGLAPWAKVCGAAKQFQEAMPCTTT